MVCPEFPPVNSTGNYRSGAIAMQLYNAGFVPIILTLTEESGEITFGKEIDLELIKKIPESIKVYRFPVQLISSFFSKGIGNSFRIWWNTTDRIDKRWYTSKVKRAIHGIIRKENPDIIFVSLPPFSFARIAIKLAQKYQLPLVVDMRDAWSLWCTAPFSTRLHYFKVKLLERKLFQTATKIITVTPELMEDFKNQHRKIPKSKFEVIYNGYDHVDYSSNNPSKVKNKDIYEIGYIGSFYYDPNSENQQKIKWWKRKWHKKFYYWPRKENWIYRSPYFFFKAINEYKKINPLGKKIIFHYIGNPPAWLKNMIAEFKLNNDVILHGFKNKRKALEIQNTWDSILATSEKIEGRKHFCLPSKTFDNVATQKPILAFITDGTQMNFYSKISQALILNPDDASKNAKLLSQLINNDQGSFFQNNTQISPFYLRESQLDRFITILKKLNE